LAVQNNSLTFAARH